MKTAKAILTNITENEQSKQYTRLSIRLNQEQTKHKRPILFVVPARTSTVLKYTVHGRDKDLFGLRHDPDGLLALFYQMKVQPGLQQPSNSVIHHVRVIGQKSRYARHDLASKELNMKLKIVVVKSDTL